MIICHRLPVKMTTCMLIIDIAYEKSILGIYYCSIIINYEKSHRSDIANIMVIINFHIIL